MAYLGSQFQRDIVHGREDMASVREGMVVGSQASHSSSTLRKQIVMDICFTHSLLFKPLRCEVQKMVLLMMD